MIKRIKDGTKLDASDYIAVVRFGYHYVTLVNAADVDKEMHKTFVDILTTPPQNEEGHNWFFEKEIHPDLFNTANQFVEPFTDDAFKYYVLVGYDETKDVYFLLTDLKADVSSERDFNVLAFYLGMCTSRMGHELDLGNKWESSNDFKFRSHTRVVVTHHENEWEVEQHGN